MSFVQIDPTTLSNHSRREGSIEGAKRLTGLRNPDVPGESCTRWQKGSTKDQVETDRVLGFEGRDIALHEYLRGSEGEITLVRSRK